MAECWACHVKLPDDDHFLVDFLGIRLCNRCECDQHTAQNKIRLPQWEAAFKQLQATKQRRL
jgi:hypothetical protein